GGTVAFYADRKPARVAWVNDAEVNTKAGYADLRHHLIPVRSNYARDRFLKRAIRVLARDVARCNLARLGVMQELSQHARAARSRIGPYIARSDRREHHTTLPGAGDQHVEPSFTAIRRNRAKID